MSGLLLTSCHLKHKTAGMIEFTRVPQADGNGQDKHDIIESKVAGAQPGRQIVIFARSGAWWVQPLASFPFTKNPEGFQMAKCDPSWN
jgi:hypothetical protein